jgi:hypothetical protein
MPNIDLSILNQRQTPAFYADIFANRPAAGFVGRIFVSTNTFAFYRDNGTSWDLIGGPGTGTVTGTGANGQVTYWNGASTITGSNDLFFDAVNGHLGIGTITPGTALDVKHDQNTVVQLEQITATNDNRIAFITSGVGLWRLGAFYNAGANDFGLFDIAAATQPVTVKRTTGQVLIGTSTVGSGKLVVASATGDNGVQIVGASAPSLRIDNAESGPTKRAGFGISTATNNFIQGSADRDFCMFNGSTTASPILFGVYDAGAGNVQEAARISTSRNFLIGTTTDIGHKLQVAGAGTFSGIVTASQFIVGSLSTSTDVSILYKTDTGDFSTVNVRASHSFGIYDNFNSTYRLYILSNGNVGIGTITPSQGKLVVSNSGPSTIYNAETSVGVNSFWTSSDGSIVQFGSESNHALLFYTNNIVRGGFSSGGNFLIGTFTTGLSKLRIVGLPTSAAGLSSGDVYSNLGVLTIVP